jgi:molecular chaperone GrpE
VQAAGSAAANDMGTTAVPATLVLLQELKSLLNNLHTSFDEKIKYDTTRQAVVDRLHAELEEYKSDLVLKVLRPVALDLINLHDDIGKLVGAHQETASESGGKLLELFASVQSDLENILYRNGFESFVAEQPEFDSKRQRAVRTFPTTDPSLDRMVANRLRKGFAYGDRIIRPEMVAVYTYKAASPASASSGVTP